MSKSLIYLLIAGGIAVWFFFLGGQQQLNNMLGSLNLGNNSSNIQTRTNTGSNISGNGVNGVNGVNGTAMTNNILNDVFSKVGLNNGQSGQNIRTHRQVNHQDTANQNNYNRQTSNMV